MYKHVRGDAREDSKCFDNRVRYSIFKTLGMLDFHFKVLRDEQEKYISEAREAKSRGDEGMYRTARSKLHFCMVNLKLLSEMNSQLEMSLQIDHMDRIIENYNSCMNEFHKQHNLVTNIKNAGKIYRESKNESDSMMRYYAELYDGLSGSNQKDSECGMSGIVSYAELDKMIDECTFDQTEDPENSDIAIDDKLEQIKSRMRRIE